MAAEASLRRRAVAERDRGLVLAAGAGSGKTRLLVDRYVSLVADDGVDPARILAITFTEKAAAEMRRRVLAELKARGDAGARRSAARAPISTIHGFAAALLRENFHLLGLDPAFGIPGAVERDEFLDAAFDDWFRLADAGFYRLAARLGESFLRGTVLKLIDQEQSLGRGAGHLAALAADLSPEREARRAEFERRRAGLRGNAAAALSLLVTETLGGKSGEKLRRAAELLPGLREGKLDGELLDELKASTSRLQKLSPEGKAHLAAFRDGLKSLDALSDDAWAAELESEPFRAELYRVTARTLEEFAAYKLRRGYVDYEDMLRLARDLLRDRPGVAAGVRRRFEHVLVDEFQDTNRLQREIVGLLTSGRPERLFVVGDRRQSIYRFRHAEVEVFDRHVEETQSSGGLAVPLAENFRSRPELVAFTSAFFKELEGEAFPPMKPAAPYESRLSGSPVEVLLVDQGKRSIAEARWEEFDRLAAGIAALVAGGAEIYDRDVDGYRRIEFRDVAVLARTRGPFGDIERSLERFGIPARAPGGREFYDRVEITDLTSLLGWIADPRDDAVAAAVLRSPFFDVSDDGLFWLARAEDGLARGVESGRLPEGLSDADRAATERARGLLAEARAITGHSTVAEVIELVAARTGYFEKILARRRGLAEHANLQRFLAEAAGFAADSGGPAAAAEYFRRARALAAVETESATELGAEDAVSVLTVHGAKGLEFPVVAVCDLGRAPGGGGWGAPPANADLGLGLDLRNEVGVRTETAGARLVKLTESEAEGAEARRVLYVAMTRARERLILSGVARSDKEPERDSARPVEWVRSVLGLKEELPESISFAGVDVGLAPPSSPRAGKRLVTLAEKLGEGFNPAENLRAPKKLSPKKEDLKTAERVLARVFAAPLAAGAALEARVTELAEMDACPRRHALGVLARLETVRAGIDDEETGDRQPVSAPGGRKLGTEVHGILEFLDFEEPGKLSGEAGKLVKRFLVSKEAARLSEAQSEGRLLREAELRLMVDGSVVSGQADVMVLEGPREAPESVYVLDYKTDRDAAEDIEKATRRHELQLRLYALAARGAWPQAKVTAAIAFLAADKVVPVAVDDEALAAAESRAKELLAMLASGEYQEVEGEHCGDCVECLRAVCGK